MSRLTFSSRLMLLALAAFFALFLLWPVGVSLQQAFRIQEGEISRWTFDIFLALFRNPQHLQVLTNSLLLAGVVTLGAILLGLPLAFVMSRHRFPLKTLWGALLLAPMILPPFVGAISMQRLLGANGFIDQVLLALGLITEPLAIAEHAKFWGVAALEILHLYPILYLNLLAAISNIDPSLEEAARSCGASPFRVFRRVTLPLLMPGLFAGAALVFIWSFGDLGTPLVFRYTEVIPYVLFSHRSDFDAAPEAYAMAVLSLGVALLLFGLARKAFGSNTYGMGGRGAGRREEIPLSRKGTLLVSAALALLLFLAVLPHLGILLYSLAGLWGETLLPESWTLQHYVEAFTHPILSIGVRNSMYYSLASVFLDILLGVSIAWLLTRKQFRGKWLLEFLAMLPLAIPGIVVAYGYLAAFRGGWLDPVRDPTLALIAAYAMRRIPFMTRAAVAGFQQLHPALEEAASTQGASPWRVFARVTLPLIAMSLVAGAILCFSFSMLEVSDSLILAQTQEHYPVTKAIYAVTMRLGDGDSAAAAFGVWVMFFLGASFLVVQVFLGRRSARAAGSGRGSCGSVPPRCDSSQEF